MVRLIVYGDIHGCYNELKDLRAKISPKKNDIEVCVGDIIMKGKDSIRVLDYLIKHKIKSVLGNHEQNLLNCLESKKNLNKYEQNIIDKLTQEHIAYLKKLPLYLKYDGIIILHGGLQNHVDLGELSKSERQDILNLKYLDSGKTFWADVYDGNQGFVVYGHQRFDKAKKNRHALGVDTSCVYGNRLSAVIFRDFRVESLSIESVASLFVFRE
jgi:bis(5'-nucleosyl)-tetraphosphatase (symmetrical)